MAHRNDLPTGTVTFVFTDIEGSTRLVQDLGRTASEVFAEHAGLVRAAVDAHGGVEIRTEGDAFFCVFSSAPDAVAAAAEIQRSLYGKDWGVGAAIRVRIGLHTGIGALGGDDYFGLDVHIAARVAAAGHGGQIVISDATRTLVERAMPAGTSLRDLGIHRLKDLAEPERLYDVIVAGLPTDFPPLRTASSRHRSLPEPLSSFIGRDRQLREVARLVESTPLVTLSGPGGVGKSRLAIEAAGLAASAFDALTFVALAPVTNPGEIPAAILRELGDATTTQDPTDRIISLLAGKRCLLVLDNFEHVLPAASVVSSILRGAHDTHILVTSRAALRLSGEREYAVPPLELPTAGAAGEAMQSEAVRLFVDRALAVRPDLTLDRDTMEAIVAITQSLDGLPLAIELAAARVRVMPPVALLDRMPRKLDLLASSSPDLDPRQRTLRSTIEWSYQLLEPRQQRLLRDLSVFRGGATLDAVEAACGVDRGTWVWLDALDALVGHSLVNRIGDEHEARIILLQTVREFALEQLEVSGDAPAVRGRHLQWFLALAEHAAPSLTTADQAIWLAVLDRERFNLRAALDHALEIGDSESASRLMLSLWRYWHMRGPLREGVDLAGKVLAMELLDDEQRVRTLEAAGGLAWWGGEAPNAASLYLEALEIARSVASPSMLANALYNAGLGVGFADDPGKGHELLAEGMGLAREIGDELVAARCLWGMASVHQFHREFDAARSELDSALEMFSANGDEFMVNWALRELGVVEIELRLLEDASEHLGTALRSFSEAGDLSGMLLLLRDHARIAAIRGDHERALRILGTVFANEAKSGLELGQFELDVSGFDHPLEALDAQTAEALLAEGRSWTVEQAVAYAVAGG